MKAACYRSLGPAAEVLELVDLQLPEPGPDEVRVRIVTSGINPTDWKTRAGLRNREPDGFQVPHHDGAGVVDAVGSAVTGLVPGRRVWLHLAAFGNRYGTAAEYALVPAARAVPLPDAASYDLGACLGVPALTAAHCLGGRPGAVAGRTVLVAGGAGAVGHFAIELAKHAGARVVATVSSEEKRARAEAAGADLVVRYTDADAAQRILDFAGRVDRIVEVAIGANLDLDLAVLATGGTIASYAAAGELALPVGRFMVENITLSFVLLYGLSPAQLSAAVSWTSEALDAGALTSLPMLPYPLELVAQAQDRVAEGPVGKVVLRVAED
ncbi:NADPH:quinone reductase [Amycolatopsis ultiminotia]|uniref:NADPH:quinone reductase n=1 Tax=Amycolatopsis ultiminotia TaxID=543629 RepID=A0ABP6XHI5_9PSEU